MAIGVPQEVAKGVVRLTLSEYTTKEELDLAVDALKENLERLRSMSVEYEQFLKRMKK
jgi:cysteine desulfurase